MFGKLGKAKQQTANTQISMVMTALDGYRLDVGDYPTQQEGLDALVRDPGSENWSGPYLPKQVPNDPWGNPYNYESPGQNGEVDLSSYGKDNRPGGDGEDADVVSWE